MSDPVVKLKKQFFSSDKVQKALDRKTRKVLSGFGARVRRTAQFSMRSRKGSSPPGVPPYSHGKKLLKKLLYFTYEPERKSVTVGPVLLEKTKEQKITRLMEEGGTVTVVTEKGVITKNYEDHPYMEPARAKHIGTVTKDYEGHL